MGVEHGWNETDIDVMDYWIHNIDVQNYNNYFYLSRKIDKFLVFDFKINLLY
jgi:hypothetical protein